MDTTSAKQSRPLIHWVLMFVIGVGGVVVSYFFCLQGMMWGYHLGVTLAKRLEAPERAVQTVGGVWGMTIGGALGALLTWLIVHELLDEATKWTESLGSHRSDTEVTAAARDSH